MDWLCFRGGGEAGNFRHRHATIWPILEATIWRFFENGFQVLMVTYWGIISMKKAPVLTGHSVELANNWTISLRK